MESWRTYSVALPALHRTWRARSFEPRSNPSGELQKEERSFARDADIPSPCDSSRIWRCTRDAAHYLRFVNWWGFSHSWRRSRRTRSWCISCSWFASCCCKHDDVTAGWMWQWNRRPWSWEQISQCCSWRCGPCAWLYTHGGGCEGLRWLIKLLLHHKCPWCSEPEMNQRSQKRHPLKGSYCGCWFAWWAGWSVQSEVATVENNWNIFKPKHGCSAAWPMSTRPTTQRSSGW